MKFIISGGIGTKFSNLEAKINDQTTSHFAALEIVDFETKEIETKVKLVTDIKYRSEEKGKDIRFNSSTLVGDTLYVSSPTQVFLYKVPEFTLIETINCEFFNDVHHLTPLTNGGIAVCSTGFDSVLLFDKERKLNKVINVLKKDPWHRFSKDIDLRLIANTKPHESHPNYVFELSGELWATRFHQKDAVCLSDHSKKFDIGIERVHDGIQYDNEIYFSCVNGYISVFNVNTFKKTKTINLNELYRKKLNNGADKEIPLGWCRSIAKVDQHLYVGFSKLRSTKLEDNIRWIGSLLLNKEAPLMPTRIVKINLENLEIEDELILPFGHLDTIFSIIPYSL